MSGCVSELSDYRCAITIMMVGVVIDGCTSIQEIFSSEVHQECVVIAVLFISSIF